MPWRCLTLLSRVPCSTWTQAPHTAHRDGAYPLLLGLVHGGHGAGVRSGVGAELIQRTVVLVLVWDELVGQDRGGAGRLRGRKHLLEELRQRDVVLARRLRTLQLVSTAGRCRRRVSAQPHMVCGRRAENEPLLQRKSHSVVSMEI